MNLPFRAVLKHKMLTVLHKIVYYGNNIWTHRYDSIDLFKKSKCRSMFVGFESGSKKIQKVLHKNLNIDEAIEKIIYISNLGIKITVSFIYGLPDEEIEDFLDTIKVMQRLFSEGIQTVQLHRYMPLPMTEEMYKIQDKLYLNRRDIDISIFNESICSNEIYDLIAKYPKIFPQFFLGNCETQKK